MIPEKSGNLDPISKCIQVRNAPAAVGLQVFRVRNIISCSQVSAEIATGNMTGDERKERWIFKSHIDLVPWNDVYN